MRQPWPKVATAMVIAAALPVAATAAQPPQPWELALRAQLKNERGCAFARYVFVNQFKLAGQDVIEGRVACRDDREFDFNRPAKHVKFIIRLCMPAAC